MTAGAALAPGFVACLARSARYRFVHTLLRPPARGRRAELAALAAELRDPPPDPALLEPGDEDVAVEAFRVLGPAGPVSPCASDYVQDGFADKGPFMADVAGFYEAFGFRPEIGENPDHFAAVFAFLSFLALKQAWALHDGDEEQFAIAGEAEARIRELALEPYFARFVETLRERAPEEGAYATIAARLGDLVAD